VAPELFRAIKVVVDTDPRSGRFLLTGSTRVLVLSSGHTQRAIGTPKLAYVDSGLACHFLGQDAQRLGEATRPPDRRAVARGSMTRRARARHGEL